VHLVLYEGVCGLCDGLVRFLLEHDARGIFTFASLQSGVAKDLVERFGADPNELSSLYVVADYRGSRTRMFRRSSAALFLAAQLGWPWRAAVGMRVLPTAILDRTYGVVARRRYRLFGRFERCLIPRPEFRHRFIDV
jgi:predicted DCC family thiol-disulfide oxidoreductase YuxK